VRSHRVTTTATSGGFTPGWAALALGWAGLVLGCATADRAALVRPATSSAAPVTWPGAPDWLPHVGLAPQLTAANIAGRCELAIADPHISFPLVAEDGSQVAVGGYDAHFDGEGEGEEQWANEGLWLIDVSRSSPARVRVIDAIAWAANGGRLRRYAFEPGCSRLRFALSFADVNEALGRGDWFEMTRIDGLAIWADDEPSTGCVDGEELQLCVTGDAFGIRVKDPGSAWGSTAPVELFVHPTLCVAVVSEHRQRGPSRERNAFDVFDISSLSGQLPPGYGVSCSGAAQN